MFKMFTRLFLFIGMIGLFSATAFADEIQIGSGTSTDPNLPTHSYYKYSYTQQIYTATEIEDAGGGVGTINSLAFYNNGTAKTRTLDVYLVNTEKTSFSGISDWIVVNSSDLVFSDSFTFNEKAWNTISLPNGFAYTGGNLAIIVDDNTGNDVSGLSCYVFNGSETQTHYFRRDGSDIDPANPGSNGTCVITKNIVKLDIALAAVTCAKPKNFNATGITAHEATLTWTAGAEGQSNWDVYVTTTTTDVPDENTTPTYQVTECSKALDNLTAQTTYYAYVRANCGDGDLSKWASKTFTTTREALAVDATHPYAQDFETSNDWGFTNGTLTNQWCWGSATNNGGSKSLYVSNDNGTSNAYSNGAAVVFASKLLAFAQGTYTIVFDWKANGESNSSGTTHYDYMRVGLVPGDVDFTAGSLPTDLNYSNTPSTWCALDGGHQLNLSTEWQTQTAEATVSGTYTMVFVWRNDGSGGSQPPAAIDNIQISFMSCPRPTSLTVSNIGGRTATLAWTENGTANKWILQYATNTGFSENFSEAFVGDTPTTELSGLMSETKYYVRVKSILDEEESSWSDVIDFTTLATCEKPTLSYVTNSNTAYTGSVSWTGSADAYELIYSTANSFNPGDEGVTQINLGNVNTYTLQDLTPETTYRIKIRAFCGEEDGYSTWSNQVSFTTTATCIKPTGLTANNVTATTATITWTAGEASQDTWNLQYKTSSDSEWQSLAVSTTTYNLSNLSPVTTYNVRVQADCGEDDLSQWTNTTNFTTGCAALALPYSYGFEENLNTSSPYSSSYPMPLCWSAVRYKYGDYNYTYYPYICSTSTTNYAPRTGSKFLLLYKTPNLTNEIAVLPELDANIKNVQLKFWGRNGNGSSAYPEVLVGVMTDPTDASTFTQVKSVSVSTAEYQEYTVDFSTYTGTGIYIAFKLNPAYSTYSYTYFSIDDITLEEIPSCLVPTGLEAMVNGANEVALSWTAGGTETAWNVQYKMAADSGWSEPIAVGETTYTLTGLQRATQYEARVQANCSANDQSEWSNPVSFETECGIWTIDADNTLSEDFNDATFPPTCWQKVNFGEMGVTNGWLRNTNNSLDNQGAVSSDFKHETWLFLPHLHLEGATTLSFDNLFTSGSTYVPCSIMISTTPEMNVEDIKLEGFIEENFTAVWTADQNNLPSSKRNETVSLSNYNDKDVYIAFRYEGNNSTSQIVWWIDNVQVAPVLSTFTKDIIGYGTGDGGYYLIASPVVEVDPATVTNMIADQEGNYDLYWFDQTEDLEWRNYKANPFNLVRGMGYLYANKNTVTLTFTGVANTNGEVSLVKDDEASFSGWNLVGNPFNTTAYIADGRSFYVMNGEGTEIIAATSNGIAPMEGVFVIAETNGETMSFTTTEPEPVNGKGLVLNLSKGGVLRGSGTAVIDRAIIRFGEGRTLPKFQIQNNNTKLYIPKDNQEYAVVSAENEGEIPISFKASENGTYTLTVSETFHAPVATLHLIDNLTGADIDLLATPSYTFEAKTTDYASRFRLVFNAESDEDSNHFAFFHDGKLTLLHEGEAILEVMDVTGRVLRTQTIQGGETTMPYAPGVYLLRLTSERQVQTQKILVK